jgi:phi13 family phage major tail protein
MAISEKKPSVKLTVGAQYICFNTMDANNDWTDAFETDVIKLPTVTQVQVTDNSDSYDSYASGAIYDSDTEIQSKDIQETNLAFSDTLLAKMRGDVVDGGVIVEGKLGTVRPYFAYGFVVQKKNGELDLRWYPKCKLVENSDSTATSEESHSDQTDDITIRAYRMSDDKGIAVRVNTGEEGYDTVTEEAFFAAPLTTADAAKALKGNA